MLNPFDALPLEIQSCIFDHLRHADLTSLMRVCHSLHTQIEPRLWTNIEFHHSAWHEVYRLKDQINQVALAQADNARNYIELPEEELVDFRNADMQGYYRYDQRYSAKAVAFLKAFDNVAGLEAEKRMHYLDMAKKVRSLCIGFYLNDMYYFDATEAVNDCWTVFTKFVNLDSLQIVAGWPDNDHELWDQNSESFTSSGPHDTLTKLTKLCLRGYVPGDFVRWACQSADTITHLELAVLDRPVGSTLYFVRQNPPLITSPQGNESPTADEIGTQDTLTEPEDKIGSSDEEGLDEEWIAPRPLAPFNPTNGMPAFKSLKSLHLTRPVGSAHNDFGFLHTLYTSPISHRNALREWQNLIHAVRNSSTLEHLSLDHRPVAESIEQESTGNDEFMVSCAHGPSHKSFEAEILPVMIEEEAKWPALKSITLHGFDAVDSKNTPHSRSAWPIPPSRNNSFLDKLGRKFKGRDVEIRSLLGRRMMFNADDGVVRSGDGLGSGPINYPF